MGLLDVVQEQPDGVHEFPVHGGIQKQENPCYLFHGLPEQQCLKKEKHGIVRKVGPQLFFRQLGKIADKHGKIGDAHAERSAFHEEFPHLLSVPFPPAVIEDDGDDEGKMACPGLISSRTDFVLPHERHVPEQLESACRGRIVFMLEDDVDVSLFAVLRGAPEDEIRDGFPQSRCDEAFPCRFKAGDIQNTV